MTNAQGYRKDIDGLRSLAVLPVLLFHAEVPGFSGGYVGVDIFFVISGFLITAIIAREIDEGHFSILKFYERRARRILPALFAMVAAVLVAASLWYLPGDFEGVPRSAAMALGFLANVWFFLNTGYFQGEAHAMPLLHTWSLGVEEQFYIGFPLLLMLVARFMPQRRNAAVLLLALVSFAIAVATQDRGDGSAFYLLPARAWELLTGSLLAMGMVPAIAARGWREAVALAGAAMIAIAVFTYDKLTVFPGVAALLPVLGSAALIHSAPGTLVGRALSIRPAVWIGLISYSLYLWHWPLIVFTQYFTGGELTALQSLAVIAASLVFAWASWRFIERPFRNPQRFPQKRIFALSLGGMAGLGALCLALIAQGGWPGRFSPETSRLAAGATDFSPLRGVCLGDELTREKCTIGAAVAPQAMVWGDSHGVEIAHALGQLHGARGQSVAQRTYQSCPPALGFSEPVNPGCPAFNQRVIAEIEASARIETIYLAGYWAGGRYNRPGFADQFTRTLERLTRAGKRVVLIGPVPQQHFAVPRRLALASRQGTLAEVHGASLAEHRAQTRWFTRHYPGWRKLGAVIFDPALVLGTGTETMIVENGHPLYFDSHHVSLTGARRLVAGMERARIGQDRNNRQ